MPASRSAPKTASSNFVASFYAADAAVASGAPSAAHFTSQGFNGSSFALAQPRTNATHLAHAPVEAAPAAPSVPSAPSHTGRVFSSVKFHGSPAFFHEASNTWWDGENSWTFNHDAAEAVGQHHNAGSAAKAHSNTNMAAANAAPLVFSNYVLNEE